MTRSRRSLCWLLVSISLSAGCSAHGPSGTKVPSQAPASLGIGIESGALGAHAPWYLVSLHERLAATWAQPSIARPARARVYFVVHAGGDVSDVKMVDSSGDSLYDRSVLACVHDSVPLPALPRDLGATALGVTATFELR